MSEPEQVKQVMPDSPGVKQQSGEESTMFGKSLRGIIALLVVTTASAMSIWQIEIKEPFYSVVTFCVAFYFGQKANKP